MTILSFNIFRTCPYWTCTICAAPGDGFLGDLFAVDRSESDSHLSCAYLYSVLRDFNTSTRTHLGPRRVVRPWVLSALSPVTSALRLSTSVTSVLRPHVTRLQVTSLTSYIAYTFLPSIEPLTPILAEISGLRLPDTLRTAPQPDAPRPAMRCPLNPTHKTQL